MMTGGGERETAGPPRAVYGRSRGKTLRVGQQRLLVEALPLLSIGPGALAGADLFPKPHETWLEIGFGAGEHLVDQAKANPNVNFIGCEPFLNGVVTAVAGIGREGLRNVRLRRGDARSLIDAAPAGFFSRVFILYPDPWPKRRHHKRRVINPTMIAALARVMSGGAELRFATDIDDYGAWTLARFLASAEFRWTAERADDWRVPWPDWRPTRYETKARREGRASVYLTFVRL